MTPAKRKITVLPGDGIGPEVVDAALAIVNATGAAVEFEKCEAGARAFQQGIVTGIPKETIQSIERTRVVLKGPLETPIGHGNRSANVTLRTLFETYGNIRPVRELPGVHTAFTGRQLDIVIVRENIEDLYAGIEYMQTPGVAESLKLISRQGCERSSGSPSRLPSPRVARRFTARPNPIFSSSPKVCCSTHSRRSRRSIRRLPRSTS